MLELVWSLQHGAQCGALSTTEEQRHFQEASRPRTSCAADQATCQIWISKDNVTCAHHVTWGMTQLSCLVLPVIPGLAVFPVLCYTVHLVLGFMYSQWFLDWPHSQWLLKCLMLCNSTVQLVIPGFLYSWWFLNWPHSQWFLQYCTVGDAWIFVQSVVPEFDMAVL